MSVSVVPAIFLALVFVLTKVDNGVALNQELSAKNKLEQLSEHVLNSKESVKKTFKTSQKLSDIQLEKDMKAIYSFITEKFNKITETDAKEITDNLINYGKKYDLDPTNKHFTQVISQLIRIRDPVPDFGLTID